MTASREAPDHSASSRWETGSDHGRRVVGDVVRKIDEPARDAGGDVVGRELHPVALHPAEVSREGGGDRFGEPGVLVEQRPEGVGVQEDDLRVGDRRDRRGMRAAVERRHRPEQFARADDVQEYLATVRGGREHTRRAGGDHHHTARHVAFEQERRARWQRHAPTGREQDIALPVLEQPEERGGRHRRVTTDDRTTLPVVVSGSGYRYNASTANRLRRPS